MVKCTATIMAVFHGTNVIIVHLPRNRRSSTVMYAHFHRVDPTIFALTCEKSIKLSNNWTIDWLYWHWTAAPFDRFASYDISHSINRFHTLKTLNFVGLYIFAIDSEKINMKRKQTENNRFGCVMFLCDENVKFHNKVRDHLHRTVILFFLFWLTNCIVDRVVAD